jgi:hypothetical protein
MKTRVLVLSCIVSVIGLAGIATATPFTVHDTESEGFRNLVREAGVTVDDMVRGVGLRNVFQEGGIAFGFTPGEETGRTAPLTSASVWTPVATVPEGGSTLLLLGAGVLALGLLRRRLVPHP